MLAGSDPSGVTGPSHSGPCLVQLPETMRNFFAEGGYTASFFSESRSNARLRVRTQATLTFVKQPPFAKRSDPKVEILIKDLSRSGIGILSHLQMWPSEEFSVELHGRLIEARVVRCKKLGERCYEVGAVVNSVATIES